MGMALRAQAWGAFFEKFQFINYETKNFMGGYHLPDFDERVGLQWR
jgi:hypothetical protein